jgi:hypothetical protein
VQSSWHTCDRHGWRCGARRSGRGLHGNAAGHCVQRARWQAVQRFAPRQRVKLDVALHKESDNVAEGTCLLLHRCAHHEPAALSRALQEPGSLCQMTCTIEYARMLAGHILQGCTDLRRPGSCSRFHNCRRTHAQGIALLIAHLPQRVDGHCQWLLKLAKALMQRQCSSLCAQPGCLCRGRCSRTRFWRRKNRPRRARQLSQQL